MFCDLHTHSCFSDGTFSPSGIIEEAERINLGAVALTDHDTVKGLPEFLSAGKKYGVEAVPGIEFSTTWNDKELHIVSLYIKEEFYDRVENFNAFYLANKEKSNRELVDRLKKEGCRIDYDEIRERNKGSVINRAHIGSVLVEKAYYSSLNEAFKGVLSEKNGLYKPPLRHSTGETLEFIKAIGAVSILAHPMVNLSEEELYAFLSEMRPDGIETYNIHYGEDKILQARRAAYEYNLLESGGSDFHGERKKDIALGTGRGSLKVPMSVLEKIKSFIK